MRDDISESCQRAIHGANRFAHRLERRCTRSAARVARWLSRRRPERTETPQTLIARLLRPSVMRWQERAWAATALGRLPMRPEDRSSAIMALTQVLDRSIRESRWRRWGRAFRRPLVATLPVSLLLGFLKALSTPPPEMLMVAGSMSLAALVVLELLLGPLILPISLSHDKRLDDIVRAACATALGEMRAVEGADSLARAAFGSGRWVRSAARQSLLQVLPGLTAAEYETLGPVLTPSLCRLLDRADEAFGLVILEALERVGTRHALPAINRYVRRGPTARARAAALRVMGALAERQEREVMRDTLLRAAVADTGEERLLRPAESRDDTDLRQLLRPSSDPLSPPSA